MYNLEQLATKELSELQAIATELGVENADKLEKNDLMFRIIDEQADAAATGANTEKATRKRTRVSVKNVDRVYSA
jgi:transcription termination factor Rho